MNPLFNDTDRIERARRGFGRAWLALALALALHVTDEALTGFLGFYNPAVLAVRGRLPWLPLPTFTFWPWLGGLAAGIALLLVAGPAARRGTRWVVMAGIPFSVLMAANALGHAGGSIYLRRLLPGVSSSPLLLAASVWLLVSALRLRRAARAPEP